MSWRRFSTEVVDVFRQNISEHQLVAKLADKAYVSWGSALGIAGAVAAYVTYDHRSQLESLKETMATKLEVADVKGQIAEVNAQLIVQGKDIQIQGKDIQILKRDIQILKEGVQEILKKLDARGR